MYHFLFPHEIDIPSPCKLLRRISNVRSHYDVDDEYGLGQDFDRLLAQQLERKLSELSRLVSEENHTELHEALVEIIRECRTMATLKTRDSDEVQA